MKKAADTGAWDNILDKVAGDRLSYAVDAQAMFNKKLRELAPGLVTASACPFRNVESYPPITLSNVDESDLQAQWEQIELPYHAPFGVDFYKRPGKKAWGHPEVWNDAGTGDQILTTLWQMVMRGADGVGCSDPVPPWHFAIKGNTDDPRLSWNGTSSVYRSLNAVLQQLRAMVRLHAEPRQGGHCGQRADVQDRRLVGRHGAAFRPRDGGLCRLPARAPAGEHRLCRGHPARHAEAVRGGARGRSDRGDGAGAGRGADRPPRRSGVAVFADGTCRPELVKDFVPLGLSFNHLEKDPSPAADDHAYWRTAAYAKAAAPQLAKALARVRPVADVENPEVFVSERRAEEGRYLFVVNNTTFGDLEPGHLWRVTLACASLVPQVVPLKLDGIEGRAVYDVFAGKQVQPAGGMVQADCRNMPARVFAILPAAIARVEGIVAPKRSRVARPMRWEVRVQDGAGKPIASGRARPRPPAGGRRQCAGPAICLGGVARHQRRVHPAAQCTRRPGDHGSGRTAER